MVYSSNPDVVNLSSRNFYEPYTFSSGTKLTFNEQFRFSLPIILSFLFLFYFISTSNVSSDVSAGISANGNSNYKRRKKFRFGMLLIVFNFIISLFNLDHISKYFIYSPINFFFDYKFIVISLIVMIVYLYISVILGIPGLSLDFFIMSLMLLLFHYNYVFAFNNLQVLGLTSCILIMCGISLVCLFFLQIIVIVFDVKISPKHNIFTYILIAFFALFGVKIKE